MPAASLPPRRRRRRLTLSLRTLLVLILAVAVGLGWWVNRVRDQEAAVRTIRDSGFGYVAHNDNFGLIRPTPGGGRTRGSNASSGVTSSTRSPWSPCAVTHPT